MPLHLSDALRAFILSHLQPLVIHTHTERQTDRQTDREREREMFFSNILQVEREREREMFFQYFASLNVNTLVRRDLIL